jgi:hypothetical protein
VPEPHDWPLQRSARGRLRPWFFSAEGYLGLLFKDGEEARRAQRGLLERGVPEQDARLYDAEQVLSTKLVCRRNALAWPQRSPP